MTSAAVINFQLEDSWTSLMTFDPAISPELNGLLDLGFAPGVDPASLIGQSFHLFIWNSPPTADAGFNAIVSDPHVAWDLSTLYTTGLVRISAAAQALPTPEPASLTLLLAVFFPLLRRRNG